MPLSAAVNSATSKVYVGLTGTGSVHAQFVVHDPGHTLLNSTEWIANVKKWVTQINEMIDAQELRLGLPVHRRAIHPGAAVHQHHQRQLPGSVDVRRQRDQRKHAQAGCQDHLLLAGPGG